MDNEATLPLSPEQRSLDACLRALEGRWQDYRTRGSFEHFVEFTLALDNLTEQTNRLRLPGLARLCEGLENAALSNFGDESTHPIASQAATALERQVETLLHAIRSVLAPRTGAEDRNRRHPSPMPPGAQWAKTRVIWLLSEASHVWVPGLAEQLGFFGFRVCRLDWGEASPEEASPLVILLIPPAHGYGTAQLQHLQQLRREHPTSQLFCLSVPKSLDAIVSLMRAGADAAIQAEQETVTVLGRVLDLLQSQEQEPHRVLVVEDSPTAVAMIRRALSQHGIDSHPIGNPQLLLAAVEQYRPDLVLMDMYMPHCTGVEATRVLRQLADYQSLPVVYLSSETDMGMQVEALRLGGDQFLTKPCNPVLLAAVVKTKIERYREMQRHSRHDSLTGLLNHSEAKSRLNLLVQSLQNTPEPLCVAMLDIDHFKSINDTYGHPAGDQVIRSLAWLLKGRLRASDIIGRYGGEEFIVVLRNAGPDEAQAVLESIRGDFATLPHAHAAGTLQATFSAGIACFPAWRTGNDLTRAADEALLEAKRQGRNRIVRASPHAAAR
ncbi:MAG: diguanylate cyclase [Zoogloeaceae bacterium]|nr:diguanylate cyclase [Zoogloeaceae bacterium]MCK6384876.1 diguanylate cyclase [Rhodocyclaceae bacterium]